MPAVANTEPSGHPELYVGNMLGVKGSLDTSSHGPCLIEFFSSAGPGGQGEKSLGIVLHIPRPGEDLFYYSFSDPADKHHSELHATATAMDGSTSELPQGLPIRPPGTFR